jgi:hypothetical protein
VTGTSPSNENQIYLQIKTIQKQIVWRFASQAEKEQFKLEPEGIRVTGMTIMIPIQLRSAERRDEPARVSPSDRRRQRAACGPRQRTRIATGWNRSSRRRGYAPWRVANLKRGPSRARGPVVAGHSGDSNPEMRHDGHATAGGASSALPRGRSGDSDPEIMMITGMIMMRHAAPGGASPALLRGGRRPTARPQRRLGSGNASRRGRRRLAGAAAQRAAARRAIWILQSGHIRRRRSPTTS